MKKIAIRWGSRAPDREIWQSSWDRKVLGSYNICGYPRSGWGNNDLPFISFAMQNTHFVHVAMCIIEVRNNYKVGWLYKTQKLPLWHSTLPLFLVSVFCPAISMDVSPSQMIQVKVLAIIYKDS